jgi:hypothetical protein
MQLLEVSGGILDDARVSWMSEDYIRDYYRVHDLIN